MAPIFETVEMHGISKRFNSLVALEDVDIFVKSGQVHALLGEKYSGKSTLMKILAGILKPDAGSMRINGSIYAPENPKLARMQKIELVSDDSCLAFDLSVTENIFLGRELSRLALLRKGEMLQRTRQTLAELRHPEIAPKARISQLSLSQRKIVHIARAILDKPNLIIFDEPTTGLAPNEISNLFGLFKTLKKKKIPIIYVSDTTDHVKLISDSFTILKTGRNAARGVTSEKSIEDLNFMIKDYNPADIENFKNNHHIELPRDKEEPKPC